MPEKGSVYIMWANASRAMAHNLDGYRQAYFSRREPEKNGNGAVSTQEKTVNFPMDFEAQFLGQDFTHFDSVEEAKCWRKILVDEINKINSWQKQSDKALKNNRLSLSIGEFAAVKFKEVAKKEELNYLEAALRCVMEWIEDNTKPSDRRNRSLRDGQ